jgi:hypothetical protein
MTQRGARSRKNTSRKEEECAEEDDNEDDEEEESQKKPKGVSPFSPPLLTNETLISAAVSLVTAAVPDHDQRTTRPVRRVAAKKPPVEAKPKEPPGAQKKKPVQKKRKLTKHRKLPPGPGEYGPEYGHCRCLCEYGYDDGSTQWCAATIIEYSFHRNRHWHLLHFHIDDVQQWIFLEPAGVRWIDNPQREVLQNETEV